MSDKYRAHTPDESIRENQSRLPNLGNTKRCVPRFVYFPADLIFPPPIFPRARPAKRLRRRDERRRSSEECRSAVAAAAAVAQGWEEGSVEARARRHVRCYFVCGKKHILPQNVPTSTTTARYSGTGRNAYSRGVMSPGHSGEDRESRKKRTHVIVLPAHVSAVYLERKYAWYDLPPSVPFSFRPSLTVCIPEKEVEVNR